MRVLAQVPFFFSEWCALPQEQVKVSSCPDAATIVPPFIGSAVRCLQAIWQTLVDVVVLVVALVAAVIVVVAVIVAGAGVAVGAAGEGRMRRRSGCLVRSLAVWCSR